MRSSEPAQVSESLSHGSSPAGGKGGIERGAVAAVQPRKPPE